MRRCSRTGSAGWVSANVFFTGFEIHGFWPAFWGAIVISIVSFFLNQFVTDERRPPRGSPRPPRGSVGPRDDDIVM